MPRAFYQNSQHMCKELPPLHGLSLPEAVRGSVKLCQQHGEGGPSEARTKPASTRLQPSAPAPASTGLQGAVRCVGPPALLPLPLRPPSATVSPPPAGPPGRPL